MYLCIALELPKESYLLIDPLSPPPCDNCARYNLNDYVVNNIHSEPLQTYTLRGMSLLPKHICRIVSTYKCKETKHHI